MSTATPFTKLLIANRGEIAVRIIRSARQMGLATVAVYSDTDKDALHTHTADEAVHIGKSEAAGSYLNIKAIIEAARTSGADAVHPGYGFLAENPDFADACVEAGLVFVGPSGKAMALMADKAAARQHVVKAGVPVVPGYDGRNQSEKTLRAEAERIGAPVMIKAAHGGGGRGMRLVADLATFESQLSSARSQAMAAFGSDTVLLEQAIENARHVEVQIAVDRDGHAVHFGERECSIQRRHQKIIEEAPSPAVSPELREKLTDAALTVVAGLGYEGLGTVEFLLASDGRFYFLEMNTRLQVEHPVTEAITGIDLVTLQLRLAAGEPLGLNQSDISFTGHAIEARICAESPDAGFLPQSGRVACYHQPEGVRCDSGIETGTVVSPYYDSLLVKVIAHQTSRAGALRKLSAALSNLVLLGVKTNRMFLRTCLESAAFEQGIATTTFVDELPETGRWAHPPDNRRAVALAAMLMRAAPPGVMVADFACPMRLAIGDVTFDASVIAGPEGVCTAQVSGETFSLTAKSVEGASYRYQTQGRTLLAWLVQTDRSVHAQFEGEDFWLDDRTFKPVAGLEDGKNDGLIRASMTGKIVSLAVKAGDMVKAGDRIVVLEAMKMEHVHTAPVDGTVSGIHVGDAQQVAGGTLLVEIKPA